jgi:hypothetical protein
MGAATTMSVVKRRADEASAAAAAAAGGAAVHVHDTHAAEERAAREREAAAKAEADAKRHPLVKAFVSGLDLVNGMACQTILYLIFVIIFQSLTSTMRVREEYYL